MPSAPSAFIQTLANHGVEVIFSLSGNQIMPLYDACIDADIRIIHTRHEASAVYMAEAYAQLSGKLGVALVTAGPGLLNAVSALYSAAKSETPVLLISGDAALGMDGRGGFQELDQIAVTAPISKFSARPKTPTAILDDLETAMQTAFGGCPGPVHLALPFDILSGNTDIAPRSPQPPSPASAAFTSQQLDTIITALGKAERPLIITGPQANRTRQPAATSALESALGMPVICLESARGLSDSFYGDLGALLLRTDLVIHLGKLADYSTGIHAAGRIAAGTPIISVLNDHQPAPNPAHDQNPLSMIRLNGLMRNIPACMIQLATAITQQHDEPSSARPSAEWAGEIKSAISRRLDWTARDDSRHPASLTASLQNAIAANDDAILVADGGEFCQWVQAGCVAPRRMINGPSGAIGGGIAYAIGASIACPDAPVFLVMGDGTTGFYLAEINTAVRAGCNNIVTIIGNDYRWNAEVQIQIDTYGADRVYGCDLDETANYADAAIGLGAHGQTIGPDDDIEQAITAACSHDGPAVLNVLIDGVAAPKFMPMKL